MNNSLHHSLSYGINVKTKKTLRGCPKSKIFWGLAPSFIELNIKKKPPAI